MIAGIVIASIAGAGLLAWGIFTYSKKENKKYLQLAFKNKDTKKKPSKKA